MAAQSTPSPLNLDVRGSTWPVTGMDELKLTAANILGSKPHQVLSNLQCVVHTLIVEHLDKATLFEP